MEGEKGDSKSDGGGGLREDSSQLKEEQHVAAEDLRKDQTFLNHAGKQSTPVEDHASKNERTSTTQPTTENLNIKKEENRTSTRLYCGHLTRNVNESHLRAIFSVWGPLKSVEMAMDKVVQLPKGYAYIEFENRSDAEKALDHMHGGQIDGNIIDVKFVLVPPKRDPSPPVASARAHESSASHRVIDRNRPREPIRRRSPIRHRDRSPIRRRSPHNRRSPRRRSPRRRSPYNHRRSRSPPRRNWNGSYSYHHRGVGSPPRRRTPPRSRRRSPSLDYRRREAPRDHGAERPRRSSGSSYSSSSGSSSKRSSMSSSSGSSGSSSGTASK